MVNALVSINKVKLRRVRLVLGWVTVPGVQLLVQEDLSTENSENEFGALKSCEEATGGNHSEYSEVHVLQ